MGKKQRRLKAYKASVARQNPTAFSAPERVKYSEDEARDDRGRWSPLGGPGGLSSARGGGRGSGDDDLKDTYGIQHTPGGNAKVQLDWAGGLHAHVAAEHGLTSRVVNPSGPGGGHPIVEFSGPREGVYNLTRNYDGA